MADSIPPTPCTPWHHALEAAQQETDPQQLGPLVTAAEDAIFARLQELNGKSLVENEEITRAVAILRELQVTRLGFPRWSGENSLLAPDEEGAR